MDVMEINHKVFVAGHRGLLESAVARVLSRHGYNNLMFDRTMAALRRDLKVSEFPAAKLPVKFRLTRRGRWASAHVFFGILAKYLFESKKGSAVVSRASREIAN